MKNRQFILFALLLNTILVIGQKTDNILNSRITFSVIMPENEEQLNTRNFAKIKSKIKQIISKSDIGATDYYSDFLIYPVVDIFDEDVLDAALQPVNIISGDLNLFVKQGSTNKQFGSITIPFKGTGNSKSKAINNGISRIDRNSDKHQALLTKIKAKIINYYKSNCNLLITEAERFNSGKKYDLALVKLLEIPTGITNCDSKITSKIKTYYKNYSNTVCNEQLTIATGYYSEKKYDKSLAVLRSIEPESRCRNNGLALMRKIEKAITKEDKQALDLTYKILKDKMDLEKNRLATIKEITLAYYKNQPDTNLNIIR